MAARSNGVSASLLSLRMRWVSLPLKTASGRRIRINREIPIVSGNYWADLKLKGLRNRMVHSAYKEPSVHILILLNVQFMCQLLHLST